MQHWLKLSGTAAHPFDDGDWARRRRVWHEEYGEVSMFPERAEELIRAAAAEFGALAV